MAKLEIEAGSRGRNVRSPFVTFAAIGFGIAAYRVFSNLSSRRSWFERWDESASLTAAMGTAVALSAVVAASGMSFVLRALTVLGASMLAGGLVRIVCNLAVATKHWDHGFDRVLECSIGASVGIALCLPLLGRRRAGVRAHG